jgi:hypothetical protein
MDTLVGLQKSRHSSLAYLRINSPLSFINNALLRADMRYKDVDSRRIATTYRRSLSYQCWVVVFASLDVNIDCTFVGFFRSKHCPVKDLGQK